MTPALSRLSAYQSPVLFEGEYANHAGVDGRVCETQAGVFAWWCWRPGRESSAAIRSGVATGQIEAEDAMEEAMEAIT